MIFLSFLLYHEDVFDSDTNEPPLKACSQTDKFINNFTFQTFKLRTTISENISKIVILTPVFIWSHLTNHIQSLSWGKRLLSLSLLPTGCMEISSSWVGITTLCLRLCKILFNHTEDMLFWIRECFWEHVQQRSLPGLSRSLGLEGQLVAGDELIRKVCYNCKLHIASIFPVKLFL